MKLLTRFQRWLDKLQQDQISRAFDEGYDFAAGFLLRGGTVEQLDKILDCPFDETFSMKAFAEGARSASSAHELLMRR